ncbi:HEAT repeat domain-containing protein [Novipirellula artificiosorum]|uniref:Flagellar basal body P-ring protein n=1 Tax=Novipirellula artificiosorum TaxID=2528016 RepID=A0A5C6DKL6_9BACT|nr:flagellar basal body P-ring protein FlgI [Novipirellula artificiosorum]TWU37308.1 flagellar basal body P-ring protein [Novipirellula artificiosorum]
MRGRQLPLVFDLVPPHLLKLRAVTVGLLVLFGVMGLGGCSSLWNGDSEDGERDARLRELLKVPAPPDLIRDAAITQGMHTIQVDGVAAVNGLSGTGGAAIPSVYRDQLLEEMRRHDVPDPNHFLELNDTALVRVRSFVPPGARRGDPVDLRILSPPRTETKDLHGGWVMENRLRHQQMLQSSVRQSEVMVVGTGPLLTRADHDPSADEAYCLEGVVLGGGRIQVDRKLGLILRPEYQHVKMAAAIAAAINRRFYFFDGTTRRGIAKAIEDDYIEIETHPRYRGNEARMVAVIHALGVAPESSATQERLLELASRLAEPATASDAALQLEGLGESAIPTLLEGLQSSNPELRFYAAEALAYLDRTEAIEPLVEAARDVAAFRHPALLALQGIEQHLAIDGLSRLLQEPSLETRYGAFCAIRRRPDGRQHLTAEALGDSFRLYEIPSDALPAIVVSLKEHPEIVVFGTPQPMQISTFLMGPHGVMLKSDPKQPGMLRVSRFQAGKDDMRATVASDIRSVIQGIAAVGGGYGDVVAVLREAKEKGFLKDQLAINPLPKSLRTYFREDPPESEEDEML